MAGWLAGLGWLAWVAGWLLAGCWLAGWLADWVVHGWRLAGWCMAGCAWLAGWLGWPAGCWLAGWLAGCIYYMVMDGWYLMDVGSRFYGHESDLVLASF